ncbi:hypothetical protein ACEPPN_019327 [Leptodophora sp. 'Broadleaf-Isolate-01']
MSASLTITETYLSLCIVLLVPTVLIRSTKRIVLLALTGLFCVASETYVFFAIPSIRNKAGIFNRSFIIDSIPTLVVILGLVFILVLMLLYFIILTFKRPPPPWDLVPSLARSLPRIVPTTGRSLVHEFFPETDTAIMELDQAVALLAGMTVLGFSLYSTADEWYRIWWEETSRESAARRIVESRAQAAEWRRSMLADEAAHRSVPEVLELSNL